MYLTLNRILLTFNTYILTSIEFTDSLSMKTNHCHFTQYIVESPIWKWLNNPTNALEIQLKQANQNTVSKK